MLLDDDPAALIQECIDNFNIASDRAALSRITSSLSSLDQSRTQSLAQYNTSLKRLTRQLHTIEQQHSLTVSSHNPTEHAAQILALDTQKFKVAKEASDLEIEGERLEGELLSLEKQLGDAENGRGGHDWDNQGTELQNVLKLKLYRSMGIDIEADAKGKHTKAVVRNMQRAEARVIDIDSRFPASQQVDRFWEAM